MSDQVKYDVDGAERTLNYLLKKKEARILKFIQKGPKQSDAEKEYVADERKLIDVTKFLVYEFKNFNLGKYPPQVYELETAILGAIILESRSPGVLSVLSILRADHFYSEAHQHIYSAIQNLQKENGKPLDMYTVIERLRKKGHIEAIGGAYYIAELTARVSSAANIEYHARIVIEYAVKRFLITVAQRIMIEAYDDRTDAIELLEAIEERIQLIHTDNIKPIPANA
jgi:hypothetical protein